MEVKFVINNPKTGKSYSKQLEGAFLVGSKLHDKVKGDELGLPGYELQLTGGSDSAGFPMIPDLATAGRKKALLTKGPGVRINREGMKRRKTVRGNVVSVDTAQVNLKIVSAGPTDVDELLGAKKEEAPAEKAE